MAITFFARRASSCENVPSPAPRSAITSGGISSKQGFGQALPGASGHVLAAELAGQLVEIGAHLVLAAAHGQCSRASASCSASGISAAASLEHFHQLSERLGFGAAGRPQAVEDALAAAAVLHQAGALQLRQMRGNAALAHVQNVLQFGDGELFAGHQQQDADAAGIGQQAQILSIDAMRCSVSNISTYLDSIDTRFRSEQETE